MSRRGALTDESIAVMKDLWTNPNPGYHGGRYRFADLKFSPQPVQKPHVPLWIGGSSPGALARAARSGDGWHPTSLLAADYATGCDRVRSLTAEAGRDPATLEMSIRFDVDVSAEPSSEKLDQLMSDIKSFEEAGAQHIVLSLNSGETPLLREWMEAIARHVL